LSPYPRPPSGRYSMQNLANLVAVNARVCGRAATDRFLLLDWPGADAFSPDDFSRFSGRLTGEDAKNRSLAQLQDWLLALAWTSKRRCRRDRADLQGARVATRVWLRCLGLADSLRRDNCDLIGRSRAAGQKEEAERLKGVCKSAASAAL